MSEQHWFDIDMCRASVKLQEPEKWWPKTENLKYVLCRHAINSLNTMQGKDQDTVTSEMWFNYGFLPTLIIYKGLKYYALVCARGVFWLQPLPADMLDVEPGGGYAVVMQTLRGVLSDVRRLIKSNI